MIEVMFQPRQRILAVAGTVASVFGVACSDPSPPAPEGAPTSVSQRAEHVGRASCAECHQNEARLWAGSHEILVIFDYDA